MCQLVSNGAFLKTTKLKNRPIKISLRFAVWSQFYQQALINKEIELILVHPRIFPSYKRLFSNFSCMFLNPNNFFQFEL